VLGLWIKDTNICVGGLYNN